MSRRGRFFANDVELAYRVEPLEERIDVLCDELKRTMSNGSRAGVLT